MPKSSLFKWRHYQPDIILCCVRWYLSYPLSYRQVEELITERGLLTLPRKSGHSRRVNNPGECSHEPKTTSELYSRAES